MIFAIFIDFIWTPLFSQSCRGCVRVLNFGASDLHALARDSGASIADFFNILHVFTGVFKYLQFSSIL